MAARIRSLQNGINPIDEASRDDLVAADVVTVSSLDAATTYAWTLVFVPEGSAAAFTGSATAVSPGDFTVDVVGAYLVRLIVDLGLPTEDTQYLRLRALTTGLNLTLVAAGERRDGTGVIPVDVDSEGWANEQNNNLLALEAAAIATPTLALVLASGNVTGGSNLIVTTGDEIQGQTSLVLRAQNNPGDNIEVRPGTATGSLVVYGPVVCGTTNPATPVFNGSVEIAATNTIQAGLLLGRLTSGVAAAGIGTGIEFDIEDDGGASDILGAIYCISSSTVAGAETGALTFYTNDVADDGLVERMRLDQDGDLQVLANLEAGTIGTPEWYVDPYSSGIGPSVIMGRVSAPTDAPFGAGTAVLMGNSTGSPSYLNYNLRVQTKSSDGGGNLGRVIIRGGDAFERNPSTPDAASVYIQAGDGFDAAMGAPGDLFLSPGYSLFGPASGSIWVVNPALSTPASLTAAGVFVGGVTGTAIFGTNMGPVVLSVDAADNIAAVRAKIDAILGLSSAGDPIAISTLAKGPNAEIYLISATAGLNAALGDFTVGGGAAFVAGTYASMVEIRCQAADVLEIGTSGAAGPLVYDSSSGKLTVPGIIDPTALVYTEAGPPATGAAEGATFVSDGTAGLTQGELYYRPASSGTPRKTARFRIPYHQNMPEVPNDTVEYRGWAPEACTLVSVRAYMETINTQGTYTLAVTNNGTGNSCLVAATFNMNALSAADTVDDLTLTATGADLVFAAKGRWTIALVSNNAAFDGVGIYIELVFEV
jgi:hypothetical protein